MYIQINGIWLTNPNDGTSERSVTSARDLAIDGQVVAQEVTDVIRAISGALFARGNLTHSITFKVTRRFTTIAAAYSFGATHRSLIPTQGELLMVCGWPSETQQTVRSGNAIVKGCVWDTQESPGVSVTHAYTLACEDITLLPLPGAGMKDSTNSPINDSTGSQMNG